MKVISVLLIFIAGVASSADDLVSAGNTVINIGNLAIQSNVLNQEELLNLTKCLQNGVDFDGKKTFVVSCVISRARPNNVFAVPLDENGYTMITGETGNASILGTLSRVP